MGSDGSPIAALRVEGGETTLMTNALWRTEPPTADLAAKTRWLESGNQAGVAMSPLINVVVVDGSFRLRSRSATAFWSIRRWAMRRPAGSQAMPLTGAESLTR